MSAVAPLDFRPMSLVNDRIGEAGVYLDVPERIYHQDPLPSPSLSASVANVLIEESPGHAWHRHPRLNITRSLEIEKAKKGQNMGVALHKLILGKGRPLKVLNFDNYMSNAAKAARDKAIAEGETPLLNKEIDAAEECAETAKRRLVGTPAEPFLGAGDAEVTIAWKERNGIWCRSRIDWLPESARQGGHITVLDLKTTEQSAKAEEWQRTMFDYGGDVQSEFYKRGLKTVLPGVLSVRFLFVVIEQKPPYAVEVCECSGETAEDAKESVAMAILAWGQCLSRGVNEEAWPMYGQQIQQIDPPTWRKYATEMRRMRLANQMSTWQRPLDHTPIKTLEGVANG